jgi:hypothetical protein
MRALSTGSNSDADHREDGTSTRLDHPVGIRRVLSVANPEVLAGGVGEGLWVLGGFR